jgi:energy-coupling factor transporter transmembrane protein EcfT
MKKSVMKGWRHFIHRLNPYIALALLAVPIAIVEPLKLIGLFIFGKGHWITGSFVMLFAYAGSLLAVDRLFKIVKPKLMTLHWFAAPWKWLMSVRQKTSQWWKLRYERSRNSRRSSLRLNRPENP